MLKSGYEHKDFPSSQPKLWWYLWTSLTNYIEIKQSCLSTIQLTQPKYPKLTHIPQLIAKSKEAEKKKEERERERERERENCNIQFQLKKMLLVEVIDSLEVLKWQILIKLGQVKQTGHHQLVLKTGKSYWLKECRKSFNSMCHLEKLGFRRKNLRY